MMDKDLAPQVARDRGIQPLVPLAVREREMVLIPLEEI